MPDGTNTGGTNDDIEVVVKLVAEADKKAAIKAAKNIAQISQRTFSKAEAERGDFLQARLTPRGKKSKVQYSGVWKSEGEYYLQEYKKVIKQWTDAAGHSRKQTAIAPVGKPKTISQTGAWEWGGLDSESVEKEIVEQKKAYEEEQARKEAEKQAEKAKREAEKLKKQAENEELRQQRMELSRKRIEFQEQKLEAQKKKFTEGQNAPQKKQLTSLQKFLNTFKRIGFYRLVRGFFAGVKNIFVQGIQGLADFDSEANKTISDMLTGYEKLKASIAVSIMPIIESLVPAVTSMTDSIVEFANNISMASAASKGLSTYTKISDKYIKDMVNGANKLRASFDKFETLGGKDTIYEEVELDPESAQEAINSTSWMAMETVQKLIQMLTTLTQGFLSSIIKIAEALEPYIEPLTESLLKILDALADIVIKLAEIGVKIIDVIDKTVGLDTFIKGLISAIVAIKALKLISSLSEIGSGISGISIALGAVLGVILGIISYKLWSKLLEGAPELVKTIMAIVASIVAVGAAITMAVMAAKGNTFGAIAAGSVFAIAAGATIAAVNAKTYADGGVPKTGSMFIAGENGAELVTTMPSGKTGVSNVQQLQQAVYSALETWWSGAVYDLPESGPTYLDGAEIARSKTFKAEINRTNPNLNLR